MSFIYPNFLYGLVAVAVPVIIHLFAFRRQKTILFSNVKHLKEVRNVNRAKQRLRHLLILFTRISAIVFLVLAFARPISGTSLKSIAASSAVKNIYLDNSMSMETEADRLPFLEAGKNSISEIIKTFPQSAEYRFTDNAFQGNDRFIITGDKLTEKLDEISSSNSVRSAEEVYRRQLNNRNPEDTSGAQLFWVSDFQKNTIGDLNKLTINKHDKLYLIPLNTPENGNIYIDTVWLDNPLIGQNENMTIRFRIKNTANDAAENTVVKLFINNIQSGAASVTVNPNTDENGSFGVAVNTAQANRCRITVEDASLQFDNEYYFVIQEAPKVTVYRVSENAGNHSGSVFSGEQIFDITTVPPGNIDYTRLSKSDLVITDGLFTFSDALISAIKAYTKKGGRLLIFPSPSPEKESYQKLAQATGIGTLKFITTQNTDKAETAQIPNTADPFFSGIFDGRIKANTNMPSAKPILQGGASGTTLLALKNGLPLLSVYGNTFLCSTPLNSAFTNFHRHALFVPIMYKTAASNTQSDEPLAYTFGNSPIQIETDQSAGDRVYSLLKEGKAEIIPEQYLIGEKLNITIPSGNFESGFYELRFRDQTVKTIAFNYDKTESETAVYTADELKTIFSGNKQIEILENTGGKKLGNTFTASLFDGELWRICLLAALFFFMIETVFLIFSRKKIK